MKNKYKPFVVVFDLDETLGNFSQLNLFWKILEDFLQENNTNYDKHLFFNLLDTFNLFLRPNIIEILDFLKEKKIENKCDKVMIYTNNNGPKYWSELIKEYLHYKLNYELFDQIIGAFKVNGKQIELCRSSHYKSISDLINCTKLPENTEIFFIDDRYHEEMKNKNVVYLHIKPYIYTYDYYTMINMFYHDNSNLINSISNYNNYFKYFKTRLKSYKEYNHTKSNMEHEIDIILSKKIIQHLEDFFNKKKTSKYTKKKTHISLNKTRNKKYKI